MTVIINSINFNALRTSQWKSFFYKYDIMRFKELSETVDYVKNNVKYHKD